MKFAGWNEATNSSPGFDSTKPAVLVSEEVSCFAGQMVRPNGGMDLWG